MPRRHHAILVGIPSLILVLAAVRLRPIGGEAAVAATPTRVIDVEAIGRADWRRVDEILRCSGFERGHDAPPGPVRYRNELGAVVEILHGQTGRPARIGLRTARGESFDPDHALRSVGLRPGEFRVAWDSGRALRLLRREPTPGRVDVVTLRRDRQSLVTEIVLSFVRGAG